MTLPQGTEVGGSSGRLADAIERYRRSLELDPKNADAARILKELEQPAAKAPGAPARRLVPLTPGQAGRDAARAT